MNFIMRNVIKKPQQNSAIKVLQQTFHYAANFNHGAC